MTTRARLPMLLIATAAVLKVSPTSCGKGVRLTRRPGTRGPCPESPQRFGIPDGLFAEPVAVKQGWMCCMDGSSWMHLSTGVMFPTGRIGA
jgi:hypothetical protein